MVLRMPSGCWHILSRYRPRFTRQLVVGPYIADIANRSARLIVELDGSQHMDFRRDELRTAYLIDQGWHVIRFWNNDVLSNADGVAEAVLQKTAECLGGTHPQPLPSREGRKRVARSRKGEPDSPP
ncbi:hypothetical protein BH10PSE12_BH10PSE12_31510 [soil metagenome]